MMDELIKRLREEESGLCANCCYRAGDFICSAPDDRKKDCDDYTKLQAADAIEQLIEERDAYRKAMTDEHNRAAKLAWEKEHCWIPVEERLPKLDENVLVYSAHSGLICIDANIHFDRNVTHWMPLPQPPKEE